MSDLPNGWTLVRVGEVVALNPKNNAAEQTQAGFSPMHLLGTGFRSSVGFEPRPWLEIRKSYTHFADGDVLLAKITPCFENGKAGLVANMPNGIGAGSSEYFVFRPKAGALDAKYLLAHFKTEPFLKGGAVRMTGSVGHKRVPKEHLLSSELPLAPIGEQKRIADKLDTVLARVDACRHHLDRVPAILKRFRQSVLAAAIAGKLTEEWRAASGGKPDVRSLEFEEDSVAIPKHWHDCPLAELIDSQRPLCYGVVQPGEGATGGVPLVRVQDMERGTVNVHGLRTVSSEVDAEYRRSRVKSGDLLVSVVGTIGRTAIVPSGIEANIARAIARIACRGGVDSRWVNIWLTSDALQWWMARSAREVARKTLNLSELGATRIAVPPADEQTEIVRRVESLFAWADRLEARHAAARAHVERLTPALLAKAFRGELVPQDPSDEPASELLERLGQRPADNPTGLPKRQGAKRSRANAAQAASSA